MRTFSNPLNLLEGTVNIIQIDLPFKNLSKSKKKVSKRINKSVLNFTYFPFNKSLNHSYLFGPIFV